MSTKKKHDIRIFREGITSDWEKRDIEEKQKFIFLLISANKYFLGSGIHFFSVILWIFSKLLEILVNNVINTADDIKSIVQNTWKRLHGFLL